MVAVSLRRARTVSTSPSQRFGINGHLDYHREIAKAFDNVNGSTTFCGSTVTSNRFHIWSDALKPVINGDNWSCIYDEANVKNMRIAVRNVFKREWTLIYWTFDSPSMKLDIWQLRAL